MLFKRFSNADLNMVLLITRLLFKFLKRTFKIVQNIYILNGAAQNRKRKLDRASQTTGCGKGPHIPSYFRISSFITIFSSTSPTSFTNANLLYGIKTD